ncbi:MAG: VCBS repeat-containing protein [Oscillospiraceae bacterium]|nr:VCBS repeat-containing protein [Oscillospiraceae bacterium]
MREKKHKILITMLALVASLFLSGCLLRISADDLYRLPELSEDYLRIQGHINTILNAGAEFSPPISGPNRQSVQLMDISGDGTNEVIAFFRVPDESRLKIYIFEMRDGDYSVAAIIEGAGTAIESIRYVDMNGDGVMEIIVGWQLGDAFKHMEIYSVADWNAVLLASAEYEGITVFDLDGDGNDDIIVLRLPTLESGAVAQSFRLTEDRDMLTSQVALSAGVEAFSRVMRGTLLDGVAAIFVEGEGVFEEGSFVTDILAFRHGVFLNVSMRESSGVSDETVRQRRILSSDVSGDGQIKVPIPRRLRAQTDTAYYAMDWYLFDSRGHSRLAFSTFHNPTDEWFLILPIDWRGRVSVRRDDAVSGERTVIFSYIVGDDGGPFEDFLKVYRLTGDAREERAGLPGRVRLTSEGTSVYAFELLTEDNRFGLTFNETVIVENFRLIFSDWLAGTF